MVSPFHTDAKLAIMFSVLSKIVQKRSKNDPKIEFAEKVAI